MSSAIVSDLAAIDLAGTSVSGPIVVADSDAAVVINALESERLLGVGVRALEDGTLEMGTDSAETLIARHDIVMAQSLSAELVGLAVCDAFERRRIDHRFLKGSAIAHTVARDPRERSFRDVDVLVQSADFDAAVSELELLGAVRLQPQLRPGFDSRFGKAVTFRLGDVEVDLHRLLAPGPFGVWTRPGDLFVLRDQFEIADRALPTLDRTSHLVHACYHVALGQPKPALSNIRDIVLIAEEDIDWERFGQTITRWRGAAVMQRAVSLVRSSLDTALCEQLDRYRAVDVPAEQRLAITPYLTSDPRGRFSALVPSTLRALPAADRVAYARAVGLPDGEDPKQRVIELVNRVRNR